MYILGLNAYHPDSSASIIKDGKLLAAVEEERFRRVKHWAGFPSYSVQYCLKEAGIGLKDLDYIALNRDPLANWNRKLFFLLTKRPSLSFINDRLRNAFKINNAKDTMASKFQMPENKIPARVFNIEHHRSHLASSFFVSPFEEAAVLSVDGFGDFTSCLAAHGRDNRFWRLFSVNYPHSLGIFYTAFTQLLGFRKFGDEYKVMGLSAYGKPQQLKKMEEMLILLPGGKFRLQLDYFSFYKTSGGMLWNNTEPLLENVFSGRLVKEFGPQRRQEDEISEYHCDLAASLQAVYEKAFFHILNYLHRKTGLSKLCLSGGCALNSLANGKIFEHTPFKEVYIQPASSDAGGSLGAAYYLYHQVLRKKRDFQMSQSYWGPCYSDEEILKQIEEMKPEFEKKECLIEKAMDDSELCTRTARYIADGKIVGWFQGRMEWGPRALGNRSIVADPRNPQMKDILNARIKRREWFRPFAPSIMIEELKEYFSIDYPDPFMLKVYPVKEEKRSVIPAVTHIDGTGRLQTVSRQENPLFWQLINEFKNLTGIGILLNTSFNENEPIVCSPAEAIDCFLRTKMDCLVMGRHIIRYKNG